MRRLLFSVSGPKATVAEPVSLVNVGLWERRDLQEWVVAHPEVLGDDVLIVTTEFDRWNTEAGLVAHERLDILGLDSSGQLVVVELKRDTDKFIHIQALTYAALVAGFDAKTLADAHAAFLSKSGPPTSAEQALDLLRNHVEGELDPAVLAVPRIILLAGEHLPQVVTTVVWLTKQGLSIELREVHAFDIGSATVVAFEVVYPVPGIDDLLLTPVRKQTEIAKEKALEQGRAANAVRVIVEGNLLAAGSKLTLHPTVEVTAPIRAAVEKWVNESPSRGSSTWVNDPIRPLRWDQDNQQWRPTTLVRHILKQAAEVDRAVRGTTWWLTDEGLDLAALAGAAAAAHRDWDDVHNLIKAIPLGMWTTYGDIAKIIGIPPITVGQHIGNCPDCPPGAHRVLRSDGKPSHGFHWNDPSETKTCHDVLVEEGVTFDQAGRASDQCRLSSTKLSELADQATLQH
jgi:alkylated DNA nucleotide flippase Atl1